MRRFVPVVLPLLLGLAALRHRPARAAAGRAARRRRRAGRRARRRLPARHAAHPAAPRVGGRRPLRGRRGPPLRPPGRRDLRAAAQHPSAVPAPVGGARRERAGAGALQPRPRAAAAPGARVAGPLPQHLLRAHLQHRPLRPVPAARRGAFLRRLRVGARLRPAAARAGVQVPALHDLARGAAGGAAGARRCPRWTSAAPTTSRCPASTTRKAAATTPTAGRGRCASIYVPGARPGGTVALTVVRGTAAGRRSRRSSA